jgi:hypothetical protein
MSRQSDTCAAARKGKPVALPPVDINKAILGPTRSLPPMGFAALMSELLRMSRAQQELVYARYRSLQKSQGEPAC